MKESKYLHAKTVFEKYECQNLVDYHDLYLSTDGLLLADVNTFRDRCQQIYKLDPAWFYTNPRKVCEAELKLTKISLDLITDSNNRFVEDGIHCVATKNYHYAKFNVSSSDDYNPSKEQLVIWMLTIYVGVESIITN